jgi:hypothetical protein
VLAAAAAAAPMPVPTAIEDSGTPPPAGSTGADGADRGTLYRYSEIETNTTAVSSVLLTGMPAHRQHTTSCEVVRRAALHCAAH